MATLSSSFTSPDPVSEEKVDIPAAARALWNACNDHNSHDIITFIQQKLNDTSHPLTDDNLMSAMSYVDESPHFSNEDKARKVFFSPIALCVIQNDQTVFEWLIENGHFNSFQDPFIAISKDNRQQKWGLMFYTALHAQPLLRLLLTTPCDVNLGTSSHGHTALMAACRQSKLDNVHLLLNNPQTNVDQADVEGLSAVHHAAILMSRVSLNPNRDILPLCMLLSKSYEAGSLNANIRNHFGNTPLHLVAREKNGKWLERVLLLLSFGANPNVMANDGMKPIDHCSSKKSVLRGQVSPQRRVFQDFTPEIGERVRNIVSDMSREMERLVAEREQMRGEMRSLQRSLDEMQSRFGGEGTVQESNHVLMIDQHVDAFLDDTEEKDTHESQIVNHINQMSEIISKWKDEERSNEIDQLEEPLSILIKDLDDSMATLRADIQKIASSQADSSSIPWVKEMDDKFENCEIESQELQEMYQVYCDSVSALKEDGPKYDAWVSMTREREVAKARKKKLEVSAEKIQRLRDELTGKRREMEAKRASSLRDFESRVSSWSSYELAMWLCQLDAEKWGNLVDALAEHLAARDMSGHALSDMNESSAEDKFFEFVGVLFSFEHLRGPGQNFAVKLMMQEIRALFERVTQQSAEGNTTNPTRGGPPMSW